MKKTLIFFASAILLFTSCKSKDKSSNNNNDTPPKAEQPDLSTLTLITDSSWGAIKPNTDFEGLKKIYGADNVKDTAICGPECADTINVTMVYPSTSKEIIVYWKNDASYHKTISSLETYQDGSPYYTTDSLRIGSTLQQLLDINGKMITFNGFDWDYGGYIADYGTGKMQNARVHFRLGYKDNIDGIQGDEEFNTDMPQVKKQLSKIIITQITLAFPE